MKNLFLPFVVVALFAIGSCGNDASINPPVDGKDTTKKNDTILKPLNITQAVIQVNSIPVLLEAHTQSNQYQIGPRHDSVLAERVVSYQDTVVKQKIEIKGDTVIISVRDSAFSTQPDGLYGTMQYTDIKSSTIMLVIDTVKAEVAFLHFASQFKRQHMLATPDPYKANSGTATDKKSFALKNVKYSKKGSAFVIEILPMSESAFAEFLVQDSSSSSTRNGGQASYASYGEYTVFKRLLPFTAESAIYIELK